MTTMPERFNVGGILLNQPFKIRRLGHFGFNLVNMDEGVRFYIDWLGFRVSDVMDYSKPYDHCISYCRDTDTFKDVQLFYSSVDGQLCDGVTL